MELHENLNIITVDNLIKYSNKRFKIRFNGNQRIHRASIGTLKNSYLNNHPDSECKIKNSSDFLKVQNELEYRNIIIKMRLSVSSKII